MLICVDLDGTLLDTVPANAASYRAALEELGFTVTDEYATVFTGPFLIYQKYTDSTRHC